MRYNPQLMLDGFTLEDMEKEAIAYLRVHEPPEGYKADSPLIPALNVEVD